MEGVDEAGTEHVLIHGAVLRNGNRVSGSGSGDHGHLVGLALHHNSHGGGGGHVADDGGDALIHQGIVAGNSLGAVAFLIVLDQLDLLAVDTAGRIELFHIHFDAIGHRYAVFRHGTGQRSQNANLNGVAAGGAFRRSRAVGGRGAAVTVSRRGAGATRETDQDHHKGNEGRNNLLHGFPSPFYSCNFILKKRLRSWNGAA